MANFDRDKQKGVGLSGLRMEVGTGVAIASVSGQSFTIATKLRKVRYGFGVMDTDAMACLATAGLTSNGQATFTRLGPITTSADTATYTLYGD